MKKNVSGQAIGAQMVSASDGSAFTGSVTVSVTGDAGTQATGSVGSGACTHEGNGYHTYAPAQAETNYDLVAFTFTGTGAVPVTVQCYTDFPQTGDSYARIGAPAGASVSADIAALPTAAGNADAVWDEARSGHVTDGTFGQAMQVVDSGTAQGGGTNTITLRAAYSSADNRIVGAFVFILSGTGAGQGNTVNAYDNTTKVATCDNNWVTQPDATSVYLLYPGSAAATTTAIASAVLDAATSAHTTAGTIGKAIGDIDTNAAAILDDTGTSGVVVGSHTSGAKAEINAECDTAMTDYGALKPTTAGRTLDVSATGEAGLDWGNIGSKTTTNALTGTTISSSQVAASVTGAVGSVTGAVGSVTGNVGGNVVGSVASVTGAVGSVTGAVGSVTGNVGGNVVGSVASVTGAVGSVTGNVGGNVVGSVGSVTAGVALTSSERNSTADAILNRPIDGAGASSRTVLEALAFLRNKWAISGSTLTVYATDDTTALFTATITSASGNPVTSVDPA